MAIIRIRDMKEMDAKTMAGKLAELKRELSIERSSAAGVGRKANPGMIRTLKRTIARLLTLAQQKGFKLEAVAVAPMAAQAPVKAVKADAKAETKSTAKETPKQPQKTAMEAKPVSKPESKNVSPEFSELIDDKASEKK
ncbi:MAG: 50S ribosomal protein L29 [Candidatus Burarchaeum sp.]|nr:50S ribosomal protein L29 [Candidatus Burarchaeum sp.]MDO8339365.1 50S ribosomal protein L29 [Candidatus Burarchaeum sp.]